MVSPSRRCSASSNGEGTIYITDVNCFDHLDPQGPLLQQAAMVGMTPSVVLRHIVNQALTTTTTSSAGAGASAAEGSDAAVDEAAPGGVAGPLQLPLPLNEDLSGSALLAPLEDEPDKGEEVYDAADEGGALITEEDVLKEGVSGDGCKAVGEAR